MTTVRIADPADAGGEPGQPPPGDDGSSIGPVFSKSQSIARSQQEEFHEGIYNIRSHSRMPERISSRIPAAEQPDEDPGLRNPDDFKQRQVGSETMRDCRGRTSLTISRYSKARCFYGWHINPWALFMAILAPVPSTSSRPHFRPLPLGKTY